MKLVKFCVYDIDISSNANGTPFSPVSFFINALLVPLYVPNSPFLFTSGYPNREIASFNAVDFPVVELPTKCTIIESNPKSSPIYPNRTDESETDTINSNAVFPITS